LYPRDTADIRHITMANIDGMRERTVVVNSLSKTYSVTGWRVGWTIASPALTSGIRKVHDFLTVGAAAPLQQASAVALRAGDDYYLHLAADYDGRRRRLVGLLESAGFRCFLPRGAYYVMTDISGFGFADDYAFSRHLLENVGVAGVPGSSFYGNKTGGAQQMRFYFCKRYETLDAAGEALSRLTG